MTDTITELDILDPEIAEYSVWVYCEQCGDVSPALDMIRQCDGAWLCGGCHWGFIREHAEQQRYLEKIRYV